MTTGWYWPSTTSGTAVPSVSLAAYGFGAGSGLIVANWQKPQIWPFLQSTTGVLLPPVTTNLDLGLVGVTSIPATSGSFYTLAFAGARGSYTAGSGFSSSTSIPSFGGGQVITGSGNIPFSLSTPIGRVYGAGGTVLSIFGVSAWGIVSDGSTVYSYLNTSSLIGTINLTSRVSGTLALPAPVTAVTALGASSGTPFAVGGLASVTLSGAAAYAFDLATQTQMLGVGSGRAILWSQQTAVGTDAWTQSNLVTSGVANLLYTAWTPNGIQALASDPVSGVVQVFQYVTSVLSLFQTVTLAGASALAALPSNVDALVCQPSTNRVQPLYVSGSSWVVSGAFMTLTAPGAVVSLGSGVAAVGYASGVALVTQTAGIWSVTATGSTGVLPTAMTADAYGNICLVGSGGAFAFVSSGSLAVLSSGAVTGTPTAVAVTQGRWLAATPAISGVYILGLTAPNQWSVTGSGATVSGTPAGIAIGGTTIFTGSMSGGTALFCVSGGPTVVQPVQRGYAGIWNGSSWTTTALGIGAMPSALAFDVSGNLNLVCTNNLLYSLSSSGTILSSGAVAVYPGQISMVPLGLSALLVSGGALYASTSLAGALARLR